MGWQDDAVVTPAPAAGAWKNDPVVQGSHGASGDWGEPNEGLSWLDKVALAAHDTDQEKELYLQKVYGKTNVRREWGDDGHPKFVVTKDGRQIHVDSSGLGTSAEIASQGTEMAGAGAGAEFGAGVGSAFGPLGTVAGGVIGAGIGAGGGHLIEEGAKKVAGTFAKTPQELAKQTGKEALLGAGGEGAGKIVGAGARKVLSGRLPSAFTGATDESRARTLQAWKGGARPPYASMAPDARKLSRIEVDAEKLTGKYAAQDTRNQAYVLNEVRKRLEDQGIPSPYISELMDQLKDPTFAFSGAKAGKAVQDSVRAHGEVLEETVKQAGELVDKQLDTRISNIEHIIDKNPPGALSEDVAAMTRNAKTQFSAWAKDAYGKIDTMLGGREVVPVEPIREAARQIKGMLPKTAVSAMTREMEALGKADITEEDAMLFKEFGVELPKGDKISLKDAQRIRTLLREKGDAAALTRSTVKGDHLFLANAVDDAIQAAEEDPSATAAIRALRTVDGQYKRGIAKFNDLTFKQIVKSVRSGMPPDPQKIASMMLQPGQTAKVGVMRKMLGEEVWKRVHSADLQNILDRTSTVNVVGTRVVDGMKLLDYLNRPGAMTEAVHGKATAIELKELGEMLAARKGTIHVEQLKDGNVKQALTYLKAAERALDNHLKKNLLAELADTSRTPEEVYRWVVTPGKETRIMEVARRFGEKSPQMFEVRQAALEELARNANINAINAKGSRSLEDALLGFTKKQQELLFPGGFADDLRELAKTIKFIYPFKSGVERDVGMAGMHAGAILEKPLKQRLYKQAIAAITRFIALHPTIARWVVTGRDPKTPWIDKTATILEGLTRAASFDQMTDVPTQRVENENQGGAGQIDPGLAQAGGG